MTNNPLKQDIERMKEELAKMEAMLEAEEKWNPKGGKYVVGSEGTVSLCPTKCDGFGTAFSTKRQAEIAARLMRERNRIIQYVLEHAPEWDFEFVKGERRWFVFYDHNINKWGCTHWRYIRTDTVIMPEWVAGKLAGDLNSGRVVL